MRLVLAGLTLLHGSITAVAAGQRTIDSSGVRIIQYQSTASSADIALSTPLVTADPEKCELNRVRGVALQASGIVIANGGNLELCFFDERGRFQRKVGRRGAGPGEFQSIGSMTSFRGDSILVVDGVLRRMSFFGPSGDRAREFLIVPPDTLGSHSLTAAFPDGTLLLGFSEFKTGAPQPDAVMLHQRLFHTSPVGLPTATVGSFPIGEHFIQKTVPEMGGVAYWTLAFGRSFSAAVLGDGFVGGEGSDFSLREYTSDGKVRAIHRLALERRPLAPDDIASYRASELKTTSATQRPVAERMLAEMPYPTHFPAYHRIITDDAGRIWIDPVSARDSVVTRWLRLDPTIGRTQGFRFPNRFRLFAVRGTRACGVGRDDVDVETVYCFGLPR